ncbi:MAG: hypothetical protein GY934_14720, partial [Gammaproteobacteria bacterium]|nr:hypothetical protein [Gammaproteobacteria bacterium]
PEQPFVVKDLTLGDAKDVKVSGGFVYLAMVNGLAVVNAADPTNPLLLTTLTEVGQVNDIYLENNRAYLATQTNGLVIVDITMPDTPTVFGSLLLGGAVKSVAAEGELAVAIVGNEVIAVGVTLPSSPSVLGQATVADARQVAIKGKHAFIAAYNGAYYPSVNFNNPVEPVVNSTPRDFLPVDVVVRGDHAFYAETVFPSAVPIVNIKDPDNPIYQALINMIQFGDYDCNGIDADLSYVYCSARNRLIINQYRELQDIAGIAPTINWQEPAIGQELFQNRPYRVRAKVEDDVRVAVVNFYVREEGSETETLVHTDITSPYTFVYKVPDAISQLSFRVEALDLAGNVGDSGEISYNINPLNAVAEDWDNAILDYFDSDFLAQSIAMTEAVYTAPYELATAGDLFIGGGGSSSILVNKLVVGGDLIIDTNSTLLVRSLESIEITGNLILKDGATLTIPNATSSAYYTLALDVAGKVEVANGAVIDLTGKGYPNNYISGPDWQSGSGTDKRWACHGGLRTKSGFRDCTYGRYQDARFPGSSADDENATNNARGGGVARIKATTVDLQGTGAIRANGNRGYTNSGGGAGGSVHIDADILMGSGSIEVRGGLGSNEKASAGRISLLITDDTGFSGNLNASSGSNAGAGTIYIKKPGDTFGELIIDNFGSTANSYSTPLPNVGRHTIDRVSQVSPGVWQVRVTDSPWRATSADYGWGVDGYWIYLDADQTAAQRYLIKENTTNTLVIETTDDLSGYEGKDLVGVHIFDRLKVRNGAWLDIGEDRLQVLQNGGSTVSNGATLSADTLPQNVVEIALNQGGGIVTRQPISIFDLILSGSGQSTISAPSLTIRNNGIIQGDGSALTVILKLDEPLTVEGDLTIDNAVLTVPFASSNAKRIYPLKMNIGGALTVTETARIDLVGKGYPANDWSGPDYSAATRESSHGGNRRHESGRAYGRYERARFAG